MLIWCEILKPMFSSRFFLRLALLLFWYHFIGPVLSLAPAVPVFLEDVARQAKLNFLNVSSGTMHNDFIIETTGNGARDFRL